MKVPIRTARVSRVPIFRTSRLRCLSPWGLELLIRKAEIVSEGQTVRENGRSSFFGSSMIRLRAEKGRDGCPLDEKHLDEVLRHVKTSPVLNLHLTRLARIEATRLIGTATPGTAYYTLSARREGRCIEITIDVEIPNVETGTRASGT
jgi:hypothetical protein